jgi:hypothetical protein
VDRGAVVGVGIAQGEAEAGRERMKRTKRRSSSAGRSPYSRTRRWLRRRKRWAVNTVASEVAVVVLWVRASR